MPSLKLSEGPNITPKDILGLPRPSAAIANPAGTHAVWPATAFDFDKKRTEKSVYLVEIGKDSAQVGPASSDPEDFSRTAEPKELLSSLAFTEVAWLDNHTVAFLRAPVPHGDIAQQNAEGHRIDHPADLSDEQYKKQQAARSEKDGGQGTEVWAKDVLTGDEYCIGKLPVQISDLTIKIVDSSTKSASEEAILVFAATVYPDGDIWAVKANDKKEEEKANGSDIKVYDELFVRHWDDWKPTAGQRKQLQVIRLAKGAQAVQVEQDTSADDFEVIHPDEGRWTFESDSVDEPSTSNASRPKVLAPLKGTKLECPVGPFGGTSDFSVSSTHLLFHSKDPHVNPAWHTRTEVYLVPLSPRTAAEAEPRSLTVGTQGACASPVLSPDGSRAAWLEMREDGYEADRLRVMIYEIEGGQRSDATPSWDRSPSAIVWAPSGNKLFLQAEDQGHVKIFELDVPKSNSETSTPSGAKEPKPLTSEHSVGHVEALADDRLLVTWNSLTTPNQVSVLARPEAGKDSPPSFRPLATLTKSLREAKTLCEGEEFWFAGDGGEQIHGWILFPPEAQQLRAAGGGKGKKWPLAFLCHGGPQSAWNDGWSTRWNPNSWAGHGYIVVAINRSGSTGFGQDFCDKIKNDWGGAPFRDLVAGLEFVKRAYPEIDADRMASLGASYGGFMQNWIQGHNDQMGFKCLVCHDGVFSLSQTWAATEELYFPEREFGGTPWEAPENYAKWNPQNHIKNWKTPELVIHGSKDYRLVEGESLGVFNTLQRLNIPSRLLIFPSENHFVLNPLNSIKWSEEVFRWIDEWCGAPAEASQSSASKGYSVEYSAGLFE
ncbi:hypothetical protein JCM3774_003195 [Rhodotorula dairenensis]